MTGAEWLTCTDPTPMLEFLRGTASERKRRLFAAACCRRIWHLMDDPRSKRAVEVAEAFADGKVNEETRRCAHQEAKVAYSMETWKGPYPGTPADSAEICLEPTPADIATAGRVVRVALRTGGSLWSEKEAQAVLVRDIFGNPFQPVIIKPAWLTSTVKQLAQAIYHDGAFDRMPILADALEEAGCTEASVLEHCRGPGPHVRGCFVVDLLLGRE